MIVDWKRQRKTGHGFSWESPGRQAVLNLLSFLGRCRAEKYFPCGYKTKKKVGKQTMKNRDPVSLNILFRTKKYIEFESASEIGEIFISP